MTTGTPGFDAFDTECRLFEESLMANKQFDVPFGSNGLDLESLGEILLELQGSIQKLSPSKAGERAQQLLDMYRVMKAARGVCNDSQAAIYAGKIHLLHIEYDKAAAAASRGRNYSFSTALRDSATILMQAYNQVKKSTSAMNLVASAMNGAASLIGALA